MEGSPVPDSPAKNLGVTIAAHCLAGNSDTKLGNIVHSDKGCYAIDFENAGNQKLVIFGTEHNVVEKMVESVAEYQNNKDLLASVMGEDAQLDTCDPHHPLMGNEKVLSTFRGWLEQSIKYDVEGGNVKRFYRK